MTALSKRKKRTDIKYVSGMIGLADLVDNELKKAYRINDDEYDFICEKATDEELGFLIPDLNEEKEITFSVKRKTVMVLNKYLSEYDLIKK